MRHARRATALLLAAGLSLGLAGCGGSDPKATASASDTPTSSTPTPTESATPTPTPTPTPTARPLSRFEGKAQVKVLRRWAAVYGREINADDRRVGKLAPLSTSFGMTRFPVNASDDFGKMFPGPLPFTPVRVREAGATSVVTSCIWSQGWGLSRKTKLPVGKRQITAADVVMKKQSGRWKVNQLITSRADCSQVPVKGLPW